MTKRAPKPLPPPTMEERAAAAVAAGVLRDDLAGEPRGAEMVSHIDMSRPRRALWIRTWANLPGFSQVNGHFQHDLLPGWQYTAAEVAAEMIPDLEALAVHGVRPTEATSGENA